MYPATSISLLLFLATVAMSMPAPQPSPASSSSPFNMPYHDASVPGVPPLTEQVVVAAGGPLPTGELPKSFSQNAYDHLQLAVYLENMESFYFNTIAESFGFQGGDNETLTKIGGQEENHVSTIETVLKAYNSTPIIPCTYNFSGVQTQAEFLSLGNFITSVGFGAAISVAVELSVSDPGIVTVIGQTVTVEARHDAFFRLRSGLPPNPSPYDTMVPAVWALNWFSLYIKDTDCQKQLKTYPTFPVLTTAQGQNLSQAASPDQTFIWNMSAVKSNPIYNASAPLYIGWNNRLDNIVYTNLTAFDPATSSANTTMPTGLSGMVVAVLTQNNTAMRPNDLTDYILAGPAVLNAS